jgi:conjugal transfer pilus assembly protein TraV
MYGVTRNRDQVNPVPDVRHNQEKASKLIRTPPAPSENLPSISGSPKDGPAVSAPSDRLPSDVMARQQDEALGGRVKTPGPYATDVFGGQNTPLPLLRQPKVLRVWVAPYIGADNSLHFPGYVYTVIQPGTWTFGQASDGAQPPMPSPAQVRAAEGSK